MLDTFLNKMKCYPPAGSPLRASYIYAALRRTIARRNGERDLIEKVKAYLGSRNVFVVSSGRAGLTLLLQALSRVRSGKHVIIPAYTCYSVPAAVIRAGLRIRFCDYNRRSFNYKIDLLEKLLDEDVLAILAVHAYGFPTNIDEIRKAAADRGVFVIEDAAQAFGAESRGRKVGTIGDAALFSLSKGKSITSIHGGIVVTDSEEIAAELNNLTRGLRYPGKLGDLLVFIKAIGYHLFSKPVLYGWVRSVPFLGIGRNIYTTRYSIQKLDNFACHLAALNLTELDRINERRKQKSAFYSSRLNGTNTVPFRHSEADGAAPIRYPVMIRNSLVRTRLLSSLERYGVSQSYPQDLPSLKSLKDIGLKDRDCCPNARNMASEILTFPTSHLINVHDLCELMEPIINAKMC